jgi:hypothetical protein
MLVATTGGALPEVAGTDGVTALLVTPNDPSALAAGLLRALGDPDLRARLGAAGRRRTLERFTWPVTARLTAEQYRILLEEQARERRDADVTGQRSMRAAAAPAGSTAAAAATIASAAAVAFASPSAASGTHAAPSGADGPDLTPGLPC